MSDQFLAEIRIFPFDFAPNGWAQCAGQILSTTQNAALFSLLGANYGGNGQTNFALPNLQGIVPIGQGQGPGLSAYAVGHTGGQETVTLELDQMPQHTHTVKCQLAGGNDLGPTGDYPSREISGDTDFSATANGTLSSSSIGAAGAHVPHNNMQPYLVLNYCIALAGIFPPRS